MALLAGGLLGCNSLPIDKQHSVGQNSRIQSLILHFTALDYQRSMWALKDSGGVSSHYLIPQLTDNTYPDSQLKIVQLVEEDQRAWHAGVSFWDGRKNLNDTSIGIEVVNVPTCQHKPIVKHTHGGEYGAHKDCAFPDFDSEQIDLLVKLAKDILSRHPDIDPTRIIGHSDVSPSRKNDPGPRFPWYQLYQQGIGAWYDPEAVSYYTAEFEVTRPSINLVQKALAYYGYNIKETGVLDSQTQDVLYAFQMHFMPLNVTGELNIATQARVFALLEKYKPARLKVLLRRFQKELDQSLAFSSRLTVNQPSYFNGNQTNALYQVNKPFYGASGQGQVVLIHPELTLLKKLNVLLNGVALDISQGQINNNNSVKLDISDTVKPGANVLTIKADSDLSLLSIDVTAPVLLPPNRWLDRKLKNQLTDGLSLLEHSFEVSVVKQDKHILHKAYGQGYSNRDLHLNQLTTLLTTQLAILKLAGEGRLNIDKPVTYYLPNYQGGGRGNRLIKHLVSNYSGYPTVENYLQALEGSAWAAQSDNLWENESDKRIKWPEQIYDVPFYYGVNQKLNYSEFNDLVLRLVVEQVVNRPFEAFVKAEIFTPLGLTHSVFRQVQNDDAASISLLTSQMRDVTRLIQLYKNQGRYGNTTIFKPSRASKWFYQQAFWLLTTKNWLKRRELSIQQCHPYLTNNSHIAITEKALVLVDQTLDISVVVQFAADQIPTGHKCGLSSAQQDVLTKVLEAVYQSKR